MRADFREASAIRCAQRHEAALTAEQVEDRRPSAVPVERDGRAPLIDDDTLLVVAESSVADGEVDRLIHERIGAGVDDIKLEIGTPGDDGAVGPCPPTDRLSQLAGWVRGWPLRRSMTSTWLSVPLEMSVTQAICRDADAARPCGPHPVDGDVGDDGAIAEIDGAQTAVGRGQEQLRGTSSKAMAVMLDGMAVRTSSLPSRASFTTTTSRPGQGRRPRPRSGARPD